MLSIRMIGRNEEAQVYDVQQAANRGFILIAVSDVLLKIPFMATMMSNPFTIAGILLDLF